MENKKDLRDRKANTYKGGKSRKKILLLQFFSLLATILAVHLYLQWCQNGLNPALVINFVFAWHTVKFLLSTGVLLAAGLWLWALSGNVRVTNAILLFAGGTVGFATYEKMRQRNEPVYPSDLEMVKEARFLLGMLTARTLTLLVITLLVCAGLFVYLVRKNKMRASAKLGWKTRFVLFGASSLALFYIGQFQQQGNLLKKAYDRTAYWIPYSQQMNYYNNGFVAGFLYNFAAAPMAMPEGYSGAEISGLKEKYQAIADEINAARTQEQPQVNIVYIMNESFADPLELEGIDLKLDPIPFTRALKDASYSGEILSQGYGGGTANIEFEALTGLSMEPFAANITTPYTQFLSSDDAFPSVVSRLEDAGYHSTAIHPFNTTMYKRKENYRTLGFDEFYYEETMVNTEKIGTNPYISDQSAYSEVIRTMENSSGKDFIHLVTMQNHTPYNNKYADPYSYQETGVGDNAIRNYLQDLSYSDQALAELVEKLKGWEEPTVVVFWGDHWPSVFGETVFSANTIQTMHETPLLIFSNFGTGQKDLGVISPIYFFSEILEMTQTQVTPFEALLQELQKEVPAFEKTMYVNAEDGAYVSSRSDLSDETRAVLADYDMIQYDLTAGQQISLDNGFFEIGK